MSADVLNEIRAELAGEEQKAEARRQLIAQAAADDANDAASEAPESADGTSSPRAAEEPSAGSEGDVGDAPYRMGAALAVKILDTFVPKLASKWLDMEPAELKLDDDEKKEIAEAAVPVLREYFPAELMPESALGALVVVTASIYGGKVLFGGQKAKESDGTPKPPSQETVDAGAKSA